MSITRNSAICALAASLALIAGCAGGQGSQRSGVQPPPGSQDLPPNQAAEVCFATARELEENGFDAQAIVQYERARQFNPRIAGVSRRLAVLYDRTGDTARANAEYQKALNNTPNDPALLNDYGYFHYVRGNWKEAEVQFRRALAIDNSNARAWNNLGLTLAQLGNYDAAYEASAKAVGPAEARANVAMIMVSHGRFDEATRSLQQALAINPDLPRARTVLEWLRDQPRDGQLPP